MAAEDPEVKPIRDEAVIADDPGEALLQSVGGQVHDPTTLLAYQMVVIRSSTQVVNPRTMAKMDMVHHAELLKHFQSPIDGRHIYRIRRTSPLRDVDRGQMLIRSPGQDLTNQPALQRDA